MLTGFVGDMPPAEFARAQKRLAKHYGSDPKVFNPSRVLRLAGTWNLKNAETRPPLQYVLQEQEEREGCEGLELGHSADELMAGLPEVAQRPSLNAMPRQMASCWIPN